MVLPHRLKNNREKIRQAIIGKIKKISRVKRQHPQDGKIRAKFLFFKEPIGVGFFRLDRLDNDSPYHEEKNYTVSWYSLSNKELMEMYHKVKEGETYCFFSENKN